MAQSASALARRNGPVVFLRGGLCAAQAGFLVHHDAGHRRVSEIFFGVKRRKN